MPQVGETKRGRELGYKSNKGYAVFIYHACTDCGKGRWVELWSGQPRNARCKHCGDKVRGKTFTRRYKGIPHLGNGRRYDKDGYVLVLLKPNDFFYTMTAKNGCVREHRLVIAKHLKRNLHRWEIVHHKNGIRDDNRLGNLQLVTDSRHNQITQLENRIKLLEHKILTLETPAKQ